MEQSNEIFIKNEIINDEEPLFAEKELKLEPDVPEYVNVNLFANVDNRIKKTENEMHQCNQCPRKYRRIEYLTIHYAIHGVEKLCPVCNEIFAYKKIFKCHLNQHIKDGMDKEKKEMVFACNYCQKTFSCKKSLVIHIRVHTNERPYKCEICGEGFKQLGSLKVHYVTHTKERRFVCEICNGSYTTGSSLRRHKRKIHDKGKVLRCTNCDAKMYNMADLKNHRINVHPDAGYKRTCHICSEVFYSKGTYRQHEQTHSDIVVNEKEYTGKTYMCLLCGEVFLSNATFVDHRRIHLGYSNEELHDAMQRNLFKCKLCPIEVKKKGLLFKHMAVHMERTAKCEDCGNMYTYFKLRLHRRDVHHRVQCQVCQKELAGRRSLKYHYEKYHPSILKKFSCRLCSQQCRTRCLLNLHVKLVHEQEAVQNYKCTHCGKLFSTEFTLDAHQDKFHKEKSNRRKTSVQNRNKRFRCRSCKKIFNSASNYKTHIGLNSCVAFIDQVRRRRKCNVCFKYLASEVTLVRHMELHSECSYNCRICGKVYKQSETIRRHMRISHPGEKAYRCECCGEGFNSLSQFKGHNNVHGEMWEGSTDTRCAGSDFIKKEVIEIKEEPEGLGE